MMIPAPFSSGVPPPWLEILQAYPSTVSPLWQGQHVNDYLRNFRETFKLLKAVHQELEILALFKESKVFTEELEGMPVEHLLDSCPVITSMLGSSTNHRTLLLEFFEVIKTKRIDLNMQETLSLEAANVLLSTLKSQLIPFNVVTDHTCPWEKRSLAVRLANKLQKNKRNKRWRKRKRKLVAEMHSKEREMYDKADQDVDEWRAREIAKDIAKCKVEKMRAIAKLKANEERKRLESELELVLIVEKLQELRSIRIQKLKKQGHFLPEEDDKFLERVRAAVEEEERQAAGAADTDAAKDAIASAEESRKSVRGSILDPKDRKSHAVRDQAQPSKKGNEGCSDGGAEPAPEQGRSGHESSGADNSLYTLPVEFYHYYHGSNTDLGTLIEVRRTWDAYLRPGGSRIPGHWVQPPLPADDIWASCLVNSSNIN